MTLTREQKRQYEAAPEYRDQVNARNKRKYADDPTGHRAKATAWLEAHPESRKRQADQRAAYAKTAEGIAASKAAKKAYYERNKELVIQKATERQRLRSIQREFERFMARVLAGDDVYGFGEAAE